jgi:hypothetical protein
MTNLLEETRHAIADAGSFVGSADGEYACSWEQFATMADQEYDSSYGAQKVARDLVIRFADGSWVERGEYDGSEWWVYKQPPVLRGAKTISRLICTEQEVGWLTVESMQAP